ncbi:MAG: VanZ family protein [Marmoricola sp.]
MSARLLGGRVPFGVVFLVSLVMLFSPGSDVPSGFPGSDKIVHFLLFLAFAVTGARAVSRTLSLAVGLACYAAASEILQTVLPINRDGDVQDAAGDVSGVVIGLVLVALLRRRRAAVRS